MKQPDIKYGTRLPELVHKHLTITLRVQAMNKP